MKRREFEEIVILDTPYYKKLQKMYRETLKFKRYIEILKRLSKRDSFIYTLEKNGGKELVYLGRTIFSLQEDFVVNYIKYLADESDRDRWEIFFERYSKNIFEIYEKFVSGDKNKVLIFEIINRKLLRDILTKHTVNTPLNKKILISERLGVVVNQLFNYIRNSLAKTMPIEDNLIIESYERIPLLRRCRFSEITQLLSNRLLKQGLPQSLFMGIFKNIAVSYYTEAKDKIINTLNETQTLSKDKISEIFSSYFFLPNEETLSEIFNVIKPRIQEIVNRTKEKKEATEQKMKEIKAKIRETTEVLSENLINITQNFTTEAPIDNMIKKMRRNSISDGYDLKILKGDYQRYFELQHELNSMLNFKPVDLAKFVFKNDWDPFVIILLERKRTISEENLQSLIRNVISETKNDKEAMDVINSYRISGFLKEKYNAYEINKKYHSIVEEVILPLVKSFLLEELIEYYPKLSGVTPVEEVRYLAEEAISGRVSLIEKDIGSVRKSSDVPKLNILQYKNLISVLIYDIRGSTLMGTKLKNAQKENEIKNFFQESMLSIAEKYNGIPIKDTGDGGIILFTSNNFDIKNQKTIVPEPGSTLSAVRCGIEMVKEARNFVQENIKKYQDWFKDFEERTIDFEGATYVTLPPLYKSIFQIGVGIASGIYPNEIFLDRNAFGKLDLTGMLVREANFYSKVKSETKSTVVCDDVTVYNLLLNIDKFSFLSEEGLRIDPMRLDTEQGLEYWINQRVTSRGFILDLYKIFVTPSSEDFTYPGHLKIVLGDRDVIVDETGEIKDRKGGRGKFLFEIFTEET